MAIIRKEKKIIQSLNYTTLNTSHLDHCFYKRDKMAGIQLRLQLNELSNEIIIQLSQSFILAVVWTHFKLFANQFLLHRILTLSITLI